MAALVTSTPPGNITLPDVLVDAIVAGAVMECIIEAKGVEQASYFKTLFEGAIASIRQGQTTMPMMTLKATAYHNRRNRFPRLPNPDVDSDYHIRDILVACWK